MTAVLDDAYDMVIIGSGAGGSTLAYGLKDSPYKILILEQADYLSRGTHYFSAQQAGKKAVDPIINTFDRKTLKCRAQVDCVGGQTKFYASVLLRLRAEDFSELKHAEGLSPAWPITYEELEPYYSLAEQIYAVHGSDQGVTEPYHSRPYPFPPRPYDEYIEKIIKKLEMAQLHPSPIPIGYLEEKKEQMDWTRFDGYSSGVDGKSDSEICCLRPALQSKNISLVVNATAQRLITDATGEQIQAVEVQYGATLFSIKARYFVVSCGAFYSPYLLLKSKNRAHPKGLANSSGLVGKNLMFHNVSGILALNPFERNTSQMQKALNIFDYYLGESDWPYPMGVIQSLGHLPFEPQMGYGFKWLGRYLTNYSVQFAVISEDLPSMDNALTLRADGRFSIHYQPNNLIAHHRLVARAKKIFKGIDYPIILSQPFEKELLLVPHACGTLRFGHDPKHSVLNPYGQSHDISNLFVVDASFFPSSAAINPTLTIAAQALRVADFFKRMPVP